MKCIKNKADAENYIYLSYQNAGKFRKYDVKDAEKRNPAYSRDIIKQLSNTTPCAVVTGSKGKGSVTCMISQILQTKMDIGMMTSPHLADFRERFRVNGEIISEEDFVRHTQIIKPYFDKVITTIPEDKFISPMGIQAALALSYFNEKKTQFNVFECGKGAQYDDVNNICHKYSVINSIFLEHTRELGSTIAEIAADKSHVITSEQKCVYVGQQSNEVMRIITQRAEQLNVPVKKYGIDFLSTNICYTSSGMRFDVIIGNETFKDIIIPLMGEHQARNCALAMAICKDILGKFDIEAVKSKLKAVKWPGRMEIVSSEPFLMVDACINSESTANIKETMKFLGICKYNVIIGIPHDKDYIGVAKAMKDSAASIILTKSSNPHYVFTKTQQERLEQEGIETIWSDNVSEAISLAKTNGLPTIMIGSTSIISDLISL